MLRSVLAELLQNWLKRDGVHEQRSNGSLTALQSLQRKIKLANKPKPEVRKPATPAPRSTKADPDRKDSAVEQVGKAPVRDVRENPAPDPNKPSTLP